MKLVQQLLLEHTYINNSSMVTSHWTDVRQCIQFANDKAVTLKLSQVNTQCRSAFELMGFCLSNPITRRL